jgi:hypothetical protein
VTVGAEYGAEYSELRPARVKLLVYRVIGRSIVGLPVPSRGEDAASLCTAHYRKASRVGCSFVSREFETIGICDPNIVRIGNNAV